MVGYINRRSKLAKFEKKIICISQPNHVLGTQKNPLNETFLLIIQTCFNRERERERERERDRERDLAH